MAKRKVCIVCGKELEQGSVGCPRKFCGGRCRSAYNNQRNAAKPQMPGGVVQCPQCGKEFKRTPKSKRECCSLKCAHRWNWRKEIEEIRRETKEQKARENPKEFREWVLSLHGKGYSRGAIVAALNLPLTTVHGWIKRQNKKTALGNPCEDMKYRHSYGYAQTADEWIGAFRKDVCNSVSGVDGSVESNVRQIYLVCGLRRAGKGTDSLCVDIQGKLGMNPLSGEIFAFCGRACDRIRYIYWDGKGFRVVSRRRERGTYPWPSENLGMTIPISANDFELLLYDDRISVGNGRSVVTWDSVHFTDEIKPSYEGANTQ